MNLEFEEEPDYYKLKELITDLYVKIIKKEEFNE